MTADQAGVVSFAIRGPLRREDLPGLFKRVCVALAHAGPRTLVIDVGGLDADAVAADALARLALAARRRGARVLIRGASDETCGLISFCGLEAVLPAEPEWQPD